MKFRIVIVLMLLIQTGNSQSIALTEAVARALETHPAARAAVLQVEQQQQLKKTSWDIPKTDVNIMYGQYNSYQKQDNNITITQTFAFPTVYRNQSAMASASIREADIRKSVVEQDLKFQVHQTFSELLYLKALKRVYVQQDSLLKDLLKIATVQLQTGEGTLLNKTLAENSLAENEMALIRLQSDWQTQLAHLRSLCDIRELNDVQGSLENSALPLPDTSRFSTSPQLALSQQQHQVTQQEYKVTRASVMPDIRLGYFSQTLIGYQTINNQERYFSSSKRFQGVMVGLSVPLFAKPHQAKIRVAALREKIAYERAQATALMVSQEFTAAIEAFNKTRTTLQYYSMQGLTTSRVMMEQSRTAFGAGEIPYATMLLAWKQSLATQEGYLHALKQYNQSIITLHYLSGTL